MVTRMAGLTERSQIVRVEPARVAEAGELANVVYLLGHPDAARVFTVMTERMPGQMCSAQSLPAFVITTLGSAAAGAIDLSAAMRAMTCHELVAGRAPTWRRHWHASRSEYAIRW
jgi:hypothetical protein